MYNVVRKMFSLRGQIESSLRAAFCLWETRGYNPVAVRRSEHQGVEEAKALHVVCPSTSLPAIFYFI